MKRKILHQPLIKMGAEMDNNKTNEKKIYLGGIQFKSKIMFIGAWGFFQLLLFI